MHDALGRSLTVGSRVLIAALVTSLSPGEDFCNVTVQSTLGRRPDGQKETISAINTGVMLRHDPGDTNDIPLAFGDLASAPPVPANEAAALAASAGAPKPLTFRRTTDEDLEKRFTHHPPVGNQGERYSAIRAKVLECAKFIRDNTPTSSEQTRAFNALDEAMFLANAAIARNEPRDPPAS